MPLSSRKGCIIYNQRLRKGGHTDRSPVPQEGEQSKDSSANEAHQNAEPEPAQLNPGISQRPKRVSKPLERYGFEDMAA